MDLMDKMNQEKSIKNILHDKMVKKGIQKYQQQLQKEIDERAAEMGGQGSGSLVNLMKGQDDEDRRILKINFNKYLRNTVSAQGEEIFKNDPAMSSMMEVTGGAGGQSPNAGLLASLQNSSSIQKKLKLLMM